MKHIPQTQQKFKKQPPVSVRVIYCSCLGHTLSLRVQKSSCKVYSWCFWHMANSWGMVITLVVGNGTPKVGFESLTALKDRKCPWPPWLADVHSRVFVSLPHPPTVHRPQKRGLAFLNTTDLSIFPCTFRVFSFPLPLREETAAKAEVHIVGNKEP